MNNPVINPGTGPTDKTREAYAVDNMKHYIIDLAVPCDFVRIPSKDYGKGRYAFLVWRKTECHEIQMPGLPLDKVRFMNDPEQNILHFPRLYVDGSSWVWVYALSGLFEPEK